MSNYERDFEVDPEDPTFTMFLFDRLVALSTDVLLLKRGASEPSNEDRIAAAEEVSDEIVNRWEAMKGEG